MEFHCSFGTSGQSFDLAMDSISFRFPVIISTTEIETDRERFDGAMSLLDSGDSAAVLHEFEPLAKGESDAEWKSSVLLGLVTCLMQLGRVAEARERWTESVAGWRNPFTDYVGILLCLEEGRLDEAALSLTEFRTELD
jgi:hypothetical protein